MFDFFLLGARMIPKYYTTTSFRIKKDRWKEWIHEESGSGCMGLILLGSVKGFWFGIGIFRRSC